jgi:fibro-slime domain-containing protein
VFSLGSATRVKVWAEYFKEAVMTKSPTTSRPNWAWLCAVAIGCAIFGACMGPVPGGTSHTGGSGSGNPAGGAIISPPVGGGAGGATGGDTKCDNNIKVVFRDFRCCDDDTGPRHPDFEQPNIVSDKGIVETTLGSDMKPVYALGSDPTQTVQSTDTFSQWYRDTDGVNKRIESTLTLTQSGADPSLKIYDSGAGFFPIDGQGWGNQSCLGQARSHNYSFTTEIHTTFTYKGGETFTFTGDDDVFAFVNNKQIIDLGGIHSALSAKVKMDDQGLTVGQTYPMDIFHAERHVIQSNFRMETRFDCLTSIIIP